MDPVECCKEEPDVVHDPRVALAGKPIEYRSIISYMLSRIGDVVIIQKDIE